MKAMSLWCDITGRRIALACLKCLHVSAALFGQGAGEKVAVITNGWLDGMVCGFCVCQIGPKAAMGAIALLKDGDQIIIDVVAGMIEVAVDTDEITALQSKWPPKPEVGLSATLWK